jgi:3-dehydroquinate synthetase
MRLLSEEYQGWSNRETWAVALHLSNDQGFYNKAQRLTRKAMAKNLTTDTDYWLASTLEEWVYELFEFKNVSTNEELFNMLTHIGSLYRVNWREIAQGYIATMISDSAIGLQGVAL